jgi:transposase InsO family protein
MALRQQLATYSVQCSRPRPTAADRAFWVAHSRIWPRWKEVLCIVQPETVVRWHRRGFRLYWRSFSKPGPGRLRISAELRVLIRRFAMDFFVVPTIRFELLYVWFVIDQLGMESKRTAYRSPWQNGTAERWIGTVRREPLDHVIVIDESHLRRLLREQVEYYNEERVHTRLRDSPSGRPIPNRPSSRAQVVGLPRVGGLHHRYAW